jgi:hypothetical protein
LDNGDTNTDATNTATPNIPNATIKPSTQSNLGANPTTTQPKLRYVNFEGPLNGSLPLFDTSIAQGYNGDIWLFQLDLVSVARYYVNALIQKNTLTYLQQQQQQQEEDQSLNVFLLGSSSGSASSSGASMGGPSTMGGNVNSFDTNNQEANVDEGDIVKSDGNTGTIYSIHY